MGRTGKTFFFVSSIFILGSTSVFFATYHTRPISYADTYAILTLPSRINDALVVEALENEGIEGTVSESTQWLMMDNFGELEQIKLSEYDERVADFDPRNDGYADKLRTFFINGSERRFYLPKPFVLVDRKIFTQAVSQAISRLNYNIGEDSHTLLDLGSTSLLSIFSIYYILAGIMALTIAAFYSRSLVRALLVVPFILSLSIFGPAGLVASGFLFAMTGHFKDSILEILIRIDRTKDSSKCRKSVPHLLLSPKLWKNHLFRIGTGTSFGLRPVSITPLIALFAFLLLSANGAVPWPVSVLSILFTLIFIVVEAVLAWSKALNSGHSPFIPLVMIPRKRLFPLNVTKALAPFAMAATLCLVSDAFLFIIFPSFDKTEVASIAGPNIDDYETHLEFQRTFSLRRLGDTVSDQSYMSYELSENGLVIREEGRGGFDTLAKPDPYPVELPPVERIIKRMNHLPNSGKPFSLSGGSLAFPSILTVAISIFLTAPMLMGKESSRRRSKYAAFLAAKRMAA